MLSTIGFLQDGVEAVGGALDQSAWGMIFVGVVITLFALKTVADAVIWGVKHYRETHAGNRRGAEGRNHKFETLIKDVGSIAELTDEIEAIHKAITAEDPKQPGHRLIWGIRPDVIERLAKAMEQSAKTNQGLLTEMQATRGVLAQIEGRLKTIEEGIGFLMSRDA